MDKKKKADATDARPNKHPGRGGNNISLAPLTPEQAISGIFNIKPEDAKRIIESKPGKRENNRKPST